ncbi:MAG: chromosomal replication initiator protein DnaA [Coriobacteriales bacterium]|jgi:chromosomal replication initiator protein|nr:chromosomal replication initiator protein DnaA [Coriobacteriales bacterium]
MNNEALALWDRIIQELTSYPETNNEVARGYLSYLSPHDLTDEVLVLATRLAYAKQWIEGRYLSTLDDIITNQLGMSLKVRIVVSSEDAASVPHVASPPVPPSRTSVQELQETQNYAALYHLPQTAHQQATQTQRASFLAHQHVQQPSGPPQLGNAPEPLISHVAQPLEDSFVSQEQQAPPQPLSQPPVDNLTTKTFETFIVGDSNIFAVSSAQGVAELPGQRLNPLFIYGRSGLGKTHLLLAIKDYISRHYMSMHVIYASSSEFINDFTSAMASVRKDTTDFRNKYFECDVLLVDDVQYFEGKDESSKMLFDIFNHFIARRQQIVLSSDRPPNEINLDERFISRFASGVTASILPPTFEMKMAIFINLKKYYCRLAGIADIPISDEVIDHIISLSGSNIRLLEGATSSIVGYIACRPVNQDQQHVTIEEIEQIVGKVFLQQDSRQITIRTIQQEVETHFGVSHADLIGQRRSKSISHPRHIAMYLSRRLTNFSYPEIGRLFGNKDHSTVVYAVKNIENNTMLDPLKRAEVERLIERITS